MRLDLCPTSSSVGRSLRMGVFITVGIVGVPTAAVKAHLTNGLMGLEISQLSLRRLAPIEETGRTVKMLT